MSNGIINTSIIVRQVDICNLSSEAGRHGLRKNSTSPLNDDFYQTASSPSGTFVFFIATLPLPAVMSLVCNLLHIPNYSPFSHMSIISVASHQPVYLHSLI